MPLASKNPTLLYSILWPIVDPFLVTFGQMCKKVIFMNWPIFRLNEEHFTFHQQYKHSGTFAKRKYEELSYPKKSENVYVT